MLTVYHTSHGREKFVQGQTLYKIYPRRRGYDTISSFVAFGRTKGAMP